MCKRASAWCGRVCKRASASVVTHTSKLDNVLNTTRSTWMICGDRITREHANPCLTSLAHAHAHITHVALFDDLQVSERMKQQ